MLFSLDELERLLERGEALGASYAEVLYQRLDSEDIEVENKALRSYKSQSFSGLGVRVTCGGSLGYASTNRMTGEGMGRALESAVRGAGSTPRGEDEPLRKVDIIVADAMPPVKVDPLDVSPDEKVVLALDTNKAAFNDGKIKTARTKVRLMVDERFLVSTDGARVRVVTPLVGLSHASVAEAGGERESVLDSRGMCAGYEFFESQDWSDFATEVSDLAIEAVGSGTSPSGNLPVVVDRDMVGLVLHEALGHAVEGDTIASGESVLTGRLGTRIASDFVTIVDEGVVKGGHYAPYDDEGVEKGRTVLVEDGFLRGCLTDRRSAQRLCLDPTGNGRLQDYENSPLARQTNFYMEPGGHSLEELVEGIDFGLLVRGRGSRGGQVEIGMGTFTFGAGPSRIIRKGRVEELVRGAVITGSVLDVLKNVDAVGVDLKVATDAFRRCGKNGQQVTTGMGGPSIRVQRMTVGGG